MDRRERGDERETNRREEGKSTRVKGKERKDAKTNYIYKII